MATPAAYRRLLSHRPAPNVLLTVIRLGLSYVALTGGVPVDQRLVGEAASSLGFARVSSVRLPDGRSVTVWSRP